MKRRTLLTRGPALLAPPAWAPALAQSPPGPKRLVVLTSFAAANLPGTEDETRQELARLGWRVGENLRLDLHYADNRRERLEAIAREVAALQPAAVLAIDQPPVHALLRHSARLPIVVAFAGDPVRSGLAASLRRPGGQVSGLTMQYDDIRPKTYELARLAAPSVRRLAGMWDRSLTPEPQMDSILAPARRMAQQVGLEYLPLPVRNAGEIESALRTLTPAREHVLGVNFDPLMFANFGATAALARSLRLPSFSQNQVHARLGGLFSYGPDLAAMLRRAVQMVDQVLRGQPVGEIPFEQPTRIALTLNRATANAIGLALAPELLVRADEVIE